MKPDDLVEWTCAVMVIVLSVLLVGTFAFAFFDTNGFCGEVPQ